MAEAKKKTTKKAKKETSVSTQTVEVESGFFEAAVGDVLVYPPWYEVVVGDELLKKCDTPFTVIKTRDDLDPDQYTASYLVAPGRVDFRTREGKVIHVSVDAGDSAVLVLPPEA